MSSELVFTKVWLVSIENSWKIHKEASLFQILTTRVFPFGCQLMAISTARHIPRTDVSSQMTCGQRCLVAQIDKLRFFFHKSGIWHHSKQRSFHRQILLQNGRKMSLVTEIDENIWYVFICVYILVRFRMIYCIFVAFMFWDTISVKRVDWDMLCFCGEMVMIAKAKATNFQDILQLAPCFFQGVSQKNPFQSSIPFTLVFFQSHSKDSIYLHYGHMLSSDFWRLC